jgi:hypothetical protein
MGDEPIDKITLANELMQAALSVLQMSDPETARSLITAGDGDENVSDAELRVAVRLQDAMLHVLNGKTADEAAELVK